MLVYMNRLLSIVGSVERGSRDLFGVYARVGLGYFLVVWVFWVVGVEGIYGHPTPFYGVIRPVFGLGDFFWHVQAFVIVGGRVFLS